MNTVIVSSKFQVEIPEDVRKLLNIQVGQKLKIRTNGNRIELHPEQPMTVARGFLQGIKTHVDHEKDRV